MPKSTDEQKECLALWTGSLFNYYRALGVNNNAADRAINTAWKKMSAHQKCLLISAVANKRASGNKQHVEVKVEVHLPKTNRRAEDGTSTKKTSKKKKKEAEKASPAKEGESFAETREKLFEQARQDFAAAFDETKVERTKHREIFDAMSVLTKSADFKKRNTGAIDIVLSVADLYAAAYNYLSCSSWQLQHCGMEKALLETASVKVKIAAQQRQGKGNEKNRNGNVGGGSTSGTSTVHNISDATVNFCKVSTYETHTRCFHNITSFAGDAGAARHCKDRPAAETRASHR